ncbi:hypothetical protein, partial [Enterococcus faecium]|uniref:hypothetical protein n=1 Tax=Enterococcus faecium TaxID=1352 RepID=UPI0039BDD6DA
SDSLGILKPRLVAPGDLARSMLHQRLVRTERFPMPPLARNRVDEAAAAAVAEWIVGLDPNRHSPPWLEIHGWRAKEGGARGSPEDASLLSQ